MPKGNRSGKLPVAPLVAYLNRCYGSNQSDWAVVTGLPRATIAKALMRGSEFQLATGERACDNLGLHPSEIWADYYERAGVA